MKRRTLLSLSAAALAIVVLLPVGRTQSTPVRFGTKLPGLGLEDDKLLVALPLVNLGAATGNDVQVTNILLGSQTRVKPASLPLSLGAVGPGGEQLLQLGFLSAGMAAGTPFRLTVEGTYRLGTGALQGFQVNRTVFLAPPNEREDAPALEATIQPQFADGFVFPPDPRGFRPDEANQPETSFPIPEGKLIGNLQPDNPETQGASPIQIGSAKTALLAANAPVSFVRLGTQNVQNNIAALFPWDPSGASVDVQTAGAGVTRLVFLTGNTYALLSTNGGATFTTLNPTTIFPNNVDGGLCCDQVVQYEPSINRVLWLMQFRRAPLPGGGVGPNRIRLASASPQQIISSGGSAWTYWDMTSATFNLGNNWMDYPDMSFTRNFLHISIDQVGTGLFIIRASLNQIQNSLALNLRYTNPADGGVAYGGHLTQDSPDMAVWYGHVTTSSLRIFDWLDSSINYSWRTVNVNSWNNANYATNAPNGVDWLAFGFGRAAIRGATRVGIVSIPGGSAKIFKVAWSAGRGGGFPQPYTRLVDVTRATAFGLTVWLKTAEQQIWNASYAFQHPYLTTNSNGEVGISVGFGGPNNHASPVVGFVGDSTLFFANLSTTTINRWGDYSAIRKHTANQRLFSVSNYFLLNQSPTGAPGGSVMHQYIMFGRTADVI